MVREIIYFEQGWSYVQTGITKLKRILEGLPEPEFDSEHYMKLYTTIYHMCTQEPPHDYSEELYDKYHEAFEEYINSTVLPDLREKHDELLLKELGRRWSNHKQMVNKEREGEQIDKTLLKNVLEMYVEIGMGKMKRYEEDFESFMLQDTASYLSHKASSWIQKDSSPDYMLKSEECLKEEEERVAHYLHSSIVPKLVKKVEHELLVVYANQPLENENSGLSALLRDEKMDDLSRMYRLYHKIEGGLEPIANIFKQHITAQCNAIVQQTEDTTTEQLHGKYMVYVSECFQNQTLFKKVLKEAFEIFIAAELLATVF